MVRGSQVTISCGFKVEFCLTKQFHGVFAWSDYSADKCTIRITDEMDMTPLQVSCWRGKFLRRTQEWYSFNYYLYTIEQWALRIWVWHSCASGDHLIQLLDVNGSSVSTAECFYSKYKQFVQRNASWNVVCKMLAILFRVELMKTTLKNACWLPNLSALQNRQKRSNLIERM